MAIPARSIDEVILELDIIIQKSIIENNKCGLFAAFVAGDSVVPNLID